MSAQMDALVAEVNEAKTVAQSAIALIRGLSQQLRDASGDPNAIQALANDLDGTTDELAEAISANTPAGEPTEPEPT